MSEQVQQISRVRNVNNRDRKVTVLRQKLFARRTAPLALQLKLFDKQNQPVDLSNSICTLRFESRKNSGGSIKTFSTAEHSDLGRMKTVGNSLVAYITSRFLHGFPFHRAFYEFRLLRGETNRLMLYGEIFILETTTPYSTDEDLDSLILSI